MLCFLVYDCLEHSAINCFWKNRAVLKGNCNGSTVAPVFRLLTSDEAEAGLLTADILAVQWWLLKKRQLVLACRLVKTAASVSICW